jgi:hypothetical protein
MTFECGRLPDDELHHRYATAASPAIEPMNSKKPVPGSPLSSLLRKFNGA